MLKYCQFVCFIFCCVLLTACQTQSTSSIGNKQSAQLSTGGFDKEKAAVIRVDAGLAYIETNVLNKAKEHLDIALKHNSSYPRLYYVLGLYYQRSKDFQKADKSFEKALRFEPKNPVFLAGYGQHLCLSKRYEKADKLFQKAIADPAYSNIHDAYIMVAECALSRKDTVKAEAYYRKALRINPNLAKPFLELAQMEFDKKRYKRSRHFLKRFTDLKKHIPRSLWLGIRIEHYLNNADAVASYALQLEQLYPLSEETSFYLNSKEQWQ